LNTETKSKDRERPSAPIRIPGRKGYRATAYDNLYDDSGKHIGFLDLNTGETLAGVTMFVPDGSSVVTPAAKAAREEWKEEERKKRQRRSKDPYIFASTGHDFSHLKAETLVRLIVLASYSQIGQDHLMETERTPMTRDGIGRVLKLSKPTITRLLQELAGYVRINEQGYVCLTDKTLLFKGSLSKGNGRFQKIYRDRIRAIYAMTEPKQHQYLGYVFQLLRYINVEYNCLCYNPTEKTLSEITYMTLDAFCNEIGFNPRKRSELKKIYRKMVFEVEGVKQYFVAFVDTDGNVGNQKVFINPNVIYSGTMAGQVHVLGGFCKLAQ